MASSSEILLTRQQHSDLSSIAQSRALPAGYVFRAKLILMLAEGASFNAIKRQLQTTSPTIVRWKQNASGNTDSRDWTPIIPAKSPGC
jgi:DNA invertase Pin-like site-specific DNA recombinase